MSHISIQSTVRKYPRHPYEHMKTKILGERYDLSLVFVGKTRARSLNMQYRKKTYVPNVLAFPLTKTAGEIFICPAVAKREAKKFHLSEGGYIAFLFIHGMLHLKGHDHSDTMEKLERKFLRTFQIS